MKGDEFSSFDHFNFDYAAEAACAEYGREAEEALLKHNKNLEILGNDKNEEILNNGNNEEIDIKQNINKSSDCVDGVTNLSVNN